MYEKTCQVTKCRLETRTREVPVCKLVRETRTRMVPVCKTRLETRTRMVNKVSFKCEQRTRCIQKCRIECQPREREVCYTVMVPQKRTEKYNVTLYDTVTEEVPETYTVCVPHTEMRTVQRRVCRPVYTSTGCGCSGDGCGDPSDVTADADSHDDADSHAPPAPVASEDEATDEI